MILLLISLLILIKSKDYNFLVILRKNKIFNLFSKTCGYITNILICYLVLLLFLEKNILKSCFLLLKKKIIMTKLKDKKESLLIKIDIKK